jgi:hypothetical protein
MKASARVIRGTDEYFSLVHKKIESAHMGRAHFRQFHPTFFLTQTGNRTYSPHSRFHMAQIARNADRATDATKLSKISKRGTKLFRAALKNEQLFNARFQGLQDELFFASIAAECLNVVRRSTTTEFGKQKASQHTHSAMYTPGFDIEAEGADDPHFRWLAHPQQVFQRTAQETLKDLGLAIARLYPSPDEDATNAASSSGSSSFAASDTVAASGTQRSGGGDLDDDGMEIEEEEEEEGDNDGKETTNASEQNGAGTYRSQFPPV